MTVKAAQCRARHTPEIAGAWKAVYGKIAETMSEAAGESPPRTPSSNRASRG
jgi:hemoglobin-like flavoprotein